MYTNRYVLCNIYDNIRDIFNNVNIFFSILIDLPHQIMTSIQKIKDFSDYYCIHEVSYTQRLI